MDNNRIYDSSRRKFILGIAIAGTGAAFGVFPKVSNSVTLEILDDKNTIQEFVPSIWVSINEDNTVEITISRSEMGQGVRTSLAMILAEELDADWNDVKVVQAQGDSKYGSQATGGSQSTMYLYNTLRNAGGAARDMLRTAASNKWGINKNNCITSSGKVIEEGGSREISYGELSEAASSLPVPPNGSFELKSAEKFKIIGSKKNHIDDKDVVTGKAIYGFDVKLPGMKYAVIARPPAFGARVNSVDDIQCLAVPGVLSTQSVSAGVAVVAESTWAAIKGREKLAINWNMGNNANLDSEQITNSIRSDLGSLGTLPANTIDELEVEYEVPYLAHSSMEPMNCTAYWQTDKCEVWAPTQNAQAARSTAVSAAGLSESQVTVNVTLLGGGFGRRLNSDYVRDAVQVSRAIREPVQVIMTKDDCVKNDYYRTASIHKIKGGVDSNGKITGWLHNAVFAGGGSNFPPPYSIPSPNVKTINGQIPIPTGAWRSVSNTQIVFVNESFIDELAHLAGKDPLQFRLEIVSNSRLRQVLTEVAERSNWGSPMAAGRGRGIACFQGYSAYIAHVIEVTVENGKVKVDKVYAVVNPILAINKGNIEGQVKGGLIDGLSTALKSEITIKNGGVEQSSFYDFQWLLMDEAPETDVHIIESGGNPSGMGEVPIPSVSPALCNAIYDATGIRVRKLPITHTDLSTGVSKKKVISE